MQVLERRMRDISDEAEIAFVRSMRGSVHRSLLEMMYAEPDGAILKHFDSMVERGLLVFEAGVYREP